MTVAKSLGALTPPAKASSGMETPATCQKYRRDVPNIMKRQRPVETLMQVRNSQRSWGNRAIRVRAAKPPTSVPDNRSRPLFSDSPTVDREQNATAKPAQ